MDANAWLSSDGIRVECNCKEKIIIGKIVKDRMSLCIKKLPFNAVEEALLRKVNREHGFERRAGEPDYLRRPVGDMGISKCRSRIEYRKRVGFELWTAQDR